MQIINFNRLTENTMSRMKQILLGKNPKIKEFAIGTPENPMGNKLSNTENKIRSGEFEKELKEIGLQYIKIVGSYGSKENSYIILNISVEMAKEIFIGYNQESFIYGDSNSGSIDYWYYQKEKVGEYKLLDAERGITMMDEAEDFFSSKKDWKFKIDFEIFK